MSACLPRNCIRGQRRPVFVRWIGCRHLRLFGGVRESAELVSLGRTLWVHNWWQSSNGALPRAAARLLLRCTPCCRPPRPAPRAASRAAALPAPTAPGSAGHDASATRSASHHTPGASSASCSPCWGTDADAPSCRALAVSRLGLGCSPAERRSAGQMRRSRALGRARTGNPGTGTWPRPRSP